MTISEEEDPAVDVAEPETQLQVVSSDGGATMIDEALPSGPEEEHATASADAMATTTKAHPKRRCWIITGVVVVVVLIAITIASVLTTDDPPSAPEPDPEYQNILDDMGINASSPDTQLEQAMVALADYFLSACSAGISVAVTRNGNRIVVPRGVLNIKEPTRLVDQDTLFEIGSVSKPVTGLILAHEIVTGNITLDTPLNELLPDSVPDLVVNGDLVTLRQLVTHTAGFPRLAKVMRDTPYKSYSEPNPYAGYTEEDMLREISIVASELSQTGEWQYSNFGFSTLAYLLGRNRNASFPSIQKELTNRLGLNNTWIELPDGARQNLSTGYIGMEEVPYWHDGGLFINGAGSTLSSTRDLLSLVELLMSPEETVQDSDLTESLKLSLESLFEHSIPRNRRGVAFAWNDGDDPPWYAHGGATAGFVTFVAFQPETKTGVVAVSNCGGQFKINTLGNALAIKLFLLPELQE